MPRLRSPLAGLGFSMNQPPLRQRYLLVVNIPVYRHEGRLFTEELWVHDLRRHLDYISDLSLFCPVVDKEPPPGSSVLPSPLPSHSFRVHAALPARGMLHAIVMAPRHLMRAWRHVGQADIVHGGAIGWPIPLGYYAAFAARWRGRFHISVMESSSWRLTPGMRASWKQRIMAFVMERMARRIARQSELALFTTREYQVSMTGSGHANSHVFKASWISEQSVVTAAECDDRWLSRMARPKLRIGFAARLVAEKGVGVLVEALTRLAAQGVGLEAVVMGEGPMEADVKLAAAKCEPAVSIRLLGRVAYGPEFFSVLDDVDLVVVPSLSDEQPRIVYDAFSRGVPVLGSRTAALRECLVEGQDGLTFGVGDASELATTLRDCAARRSDLARMGRNARATALDQTHERMHADRHRLIEQAWSLRSRGSH